MCAEEKQHNRHAEQKLLGRGVLCAVVDLLPHIEVVKGSAVEFERHTTDIVEHDVRAEHVGNVGQGPGRFLRDARDDIVEDLKASYQDDMDGPCSWQRIQLLASVSEDCVRKGYGWVSSHTFGVGPVGVQIRQSCLVAYLLKGLERLMVDLEEAARSPPACARVASIGHVEVNASASDGSRRIVARVEGDGALQKNWRRQLGGIAGARSEAAVSSTATRVRGSPTRVLVPIRV